MSFRTKTILLFLLTSLMPYLLVIVYIIHNTKSEVVSELNRDIDFSLELVGERLDNQLAVLQKEFIFIAKLDIMDDIMSQDIDRRISNLFKDKKADMRLKGDFFATNLKGEVVASSNIQAISKKFELNQTNTKIFQYNIVGSFNNQKIGTIYLTYHLDNLKALLKSKSNQMLYLHNNQTNLNLFKTKHFAQSIVRSKPIAKLKNMELFIEMDKQQALMLYNHFQLILLFSLLAGAVLISLVSIYFASKITKPINNLSQTALSIASTKDYAKRVSIHSSDEIGKMAKAFNELVMSIEKALAELEIQNQHKLKLIEEKSKNEMFEELSCKLSKYLSPQIYHSIFEGQQDVKLESKRKKLTIFFSDIVDFTATTESMESEDLSSLLNHYLNEMSLIALKHGATIDKFIGDAILIFFGDPTSNGVKADAKACLDMSLEMIAKVKELENYWLELGVPKPFRIRIGIHTGFSTVGNFGSEDRMDYTIIGGAVNLASRIESKAKPNEIWISQETYLLIKDSIYCQEQEAISAKGIT
ncbi:MAG: HAMP domain-containing protein, partial [Campylobacterales bacterium]|nr:HAMP domain-containing protein [Campylobacterales bacterium]